MSVSLWLDTFRGNPATTRDNPALLRERKDERTQRADDFASIEDARAGAKRMYHDDRVLRVMLIVDGTSTFVEWIER